MKKLGKILLVLVVVLIVVVASGLTYLSVGLPNVPEAEDLKIEYSAELVERGEYLANAVMVCMDCHSERDWSKFSGPIVEGTLGKGGEVFDQNMSFPGRYVSKNITPHHLSSWTDGEIFRAITAGVSKDGKALFPIMPYHHYGTLDRRDIEAVIAYIRTLPAIESEPEKSESDFPMNFIINTLPHEPQFVTRPSEADLVAYGKYMTNAAGCYDCHTRQEKGSFVGQEYAGGMEFKMPDGAVMRSANITPQEGSGIGSWTAEQFVNRFKQYSDSGYVFPSTPSGTFQSIMPWSMYTHMAEHDLESIYAYLMTIEPVENQVQWYSPPPAE